MKFSSLTGGIIGCGMAALALPAMAEWFGTLEAGVIYDSNLSRSERSFDVESDAGLRGLIEGGKVFRLEHGNALAVAADLEYTVFDEFSGMRHLTAGLTGSWRKRFGLGPFAPDMFARVRAERLAFDDSIRSGWFYLGEIGGSKRLSERWEIEAAGFYERRRGSSSRADSVFDQQRLGASVSGHFAVSDAWLLRAGYAYRRGDIDSNATSNERIIAASKARVPDSVFGDGRVVYRLKADVHTFSADLTRALTRDSSLVLAYEFQAVRARGGIDYQRNQVTLNYVYTF